MLRSTRGHRQRRQREGPRADLRHGEPRPRAVRHAGPAGQQPRRIDDARPRCRAPHQRQHHPPVAAGHRRPVQPGRPAQERVGEPAAPDVRRRQPLRQPGPVDRQRGDALETANCASTPRCRSATASCPTPCSGCPARPSSSTRSCAATRRRWKARSREAENRARSLTQQTGRRRPRPTPQAAAAELERLRTQTDAQAARALEDMRTKVSGVSRRCRSTWAHRQPLQRDLRDLKARAAAPPPTCRSSRSACAPRPSACPSPRARARRPCATRSPTSCARSSSSRACPPASAAT